jgi:hypothetical protein
MQQQMQAGASQNAASADPGLGGGRTSGALESGGAPSSGAAAAAAASAGSGAVCPPHPGFMRGICIRCGTAQPEEADPAAEPGVALRRVARTEQHMDECQERIQSDKSQQGVAFRKRLPRSAWPTGRLPHPPPGRPAALQLSVRRDAGCRYIKADFRISGAEAARLRAANLKRLLTARKLLLVLDLDHTLLNSCRCGRCSSAEEEQVHRQAAWLPPHKLNLTRNPDNGN